MAERTYNARMACPFPLMPGRLREKEVWVRLQKMISWFGLFFVSFVYVLALIKILS